MDHGLRSRSFICPPNKNEVFFLYHGFALGMAIVAIPFHPNIEVLSRSLKKEQQSGRLMGIAIDNARDSMIHLLFVGNIFTVA